MSIDRTALRGVSALALLLAASACASIEDRELYGYQDPGFGSANRATYAAQVVNPDPVYDEPMESSASRAVDAVDAYRDKTVEEPDTISTTEGVSTGPGA
ncbi:hypothetical protein GRI38_08140 [Altererythrobacter aurantiacus]|uniref:Uncharacterized protein n=1 Tax=Parapontixanthobacter aurantiacus TaxID=1463599 RepID=A0A844ZFI2_9SPHN|nr:hypothetical protein [Parapontixanthobacter aurantiacus]MXO86002.1 hypothetical protein [Parapontixanthobacter aurantiacus]